MDYILGLDIGIASVGYAICSIDEKDEVNSLIDLGVRTFDKAEVPKTGASLNDKRRECRGKRRLIRRKKGRLKALRKLLLEQGILTENDLNTDGTIKNLPNNPWKLRGKESLVRKLTNIEFAAILIHLLKHRGYKVVRKSELKDAKDENGKVLSAIKSNKEKIKKSGKTCAQLALEFQKECNHIRNKQGQYNHCFGRDNLLDEFNKIIKSQQELKNDLATDELRDEFIKIFEYQKESLSGYALLNMVGKCTFEKDHFRAAKNTYSVERHVWLTKLNNLRILQDGYLRGLTCEEREKLIDIPYQQAKLTFEEIEKLIDIPYQQAKLTFGEDKDTFMEFKAFHKIKEVIEENKDQWEIIKNSPALMDAIGTAFSVYKVDDEIQKALVGEDNKFIDLLKPAYPNIEYELKKLDKSTIDELINNINFDKFSNLSLLALSKILPEMEKGKRYDEAVEKIYPNFKKAKESKDKFLPKIPTDDINNPVVIRALSQTRKLINAVIVKYGSPAKINIELARDVGKSKKARKEIDEANKKNKAENDRLKKEFKDHFKREPKKDELTKYRLYKQQHCKCLYSDNSIDINRLLEQSYVEVDHALPFSRTCDNSLNNKVLCLSQHNQNKGNKTPYEYLDGKSNDSRWKNFKALVDSTNFSKYKKQYLLTQEIKETDFKERNLNDTRYIARFLKKFIEDNLEFNNININKSKKVVCTNGRITSFLRNKWGLNKNREESDRHHALDACVIACTNEYLIQKVTNWYQQEEKIFVNKNNKFLPQPWEFFRDEVNIRVFSDNPIQDLEKKPDIFNKINKDLIKPLFVSRAPNRKVSGAIHDETLRRYYPSPEDQNEISTNRNSINDLTKSNIEHLHDKERNIKLYNLLKDNAFVKYNGSEVPLNEYIENKYKSKKENLIFKEPLYLSEKDRLANRPIKKVTLQKTQKRGFEFTKIKAIANNATMLRADIFENKGKYYAVPIYLHEITATQAPNIITNGKDVLEEGFNFKFSLYKNDLVKVDTKGIHSNKEQSCLYYIGLDVEGSGRLIFKVHDSNNSDDNFDNGKFIKNKLGKDKIRLSFQNFKTFEKYAVDVLGNKFKIQSEQRQWFKLKNSKEKNLNKVVKNGELEEI